MYYTSEWLHAIRDSHNEDMTAVKHAKIDYTLVHRVLLMRTDLVDGWAKRLSCPLNQFDLFMLTIHKHPPPENVTNCISQSKNTLTIPQWLPVELVIHAKERYASLLRLSSLEFSSSSFEDFTLPGERIAYLEHLLDSSSGQVELGMFLGKGLISKDDHFYNMAMDYLELAIALHEKFPQVIDHIYTSITSLEAERCQQNSARIITALKKTPNFARIIAESLMERIQDKHLFEDTTGSSLGLSPADMALKLTKYLPIWLSVLGNCLILSAGRAGFYQQIDLLLTLPIHFGEDCELACAWIRSLLNIFTNATDNFNASKYCTLRLAQLADLEGHIDSKRTLYPCNEAVAEVVKQIIGGDLSPCALTFVESTSGVICPLQPSVLNLLSNDLLSSVGKVREEEGEKEKAGTLEDGTKNAELALLKLIALMEDWIRSGVQFEHSALRILANQDYYRSVALNLCFQYERAFGVFPIDIEHMSDTNESRIVLLRLLNSDATSAIIKTVNALEESTLKENQDVLCRILTRNPSLIKDIVTRFSSSMWAFKSCCSALAAVDDFGSLSETLTVLHSAKSVIDVCVDKRESIEHQLILLKNIKLLLQNFEEKCLEKLNANFSIDTDSVIAVLKALQTCTRPIHSLCSSGKSSNSELAVHIPVLKKILESVLFKVKIMMKENNCLSAFWMGNLKDRNAQK